MSRFGLDEDLLVCTRNIGGTEAFVWISTKEFFVGGLGKQLFSSFPTLLSRLLQIMDNGPFPIKREERWQLVGLQTGKLKYNFERVIGCSKRHDAGSIVVVVVAVTAVDVVSIFIRWNCDVVVAATCPIFCPWSCRSLPLLLLLEEEPKIHQTPIQGDSF